MINKLIIALILLLSFASTTNAQDKKTDSIAKKMGISLTVQPFFFAVAAGKLDLELQPLNHKFAYIVTGEFYDGEVQDGELFDFKDNAWDKISGFGIGLMQKYKFKEKRSSPYVAYGATYRNQKIAIETEGFYPYQENGLTYYDYGPIEKSLKINSLLIGGTMGYQKISGSFVFDIYAGLGYKTPLGKNNLEGYREYDKDITVYAYKGFGMLLGFKIGMQFQ